MIDVDDLVLLVFLDALPGLFVPLDGVQKRLVVVDGLVFHPNARLQDDFFPQHSGYETDHKPHSPVEPAERERPESILVQLDLEILVVGHLVAHGRDELTVEFAGSVRDLERVDGRGHQFKVVQRTQTLLDGFAPLRAEILSPLPNVRQLHRGPDGIIVLFHESFPVLLHTPERIRQMYSYRGAR